MLTTAGRIKAVEMSRALVDALKTTKLQFPLDFAGGFAEMKALFHSFAQGRGYPIGYGFRLWNMLPQALSNLLCFLDEMTGVWRYEYGVPIEIGTRILIGTTMFPSVETLFDVVGCAQWRLEAKELQDYLTRLTDKGKHEDTLTEFAPILRLSGEVRVKNEVSTGTEGNATVDWHIEQPGGPPLYLEVKNRIFDLVEHFEVLHSDDAIPEPSHDHRKLFRSVEKKFNARNPTDAIQAVWLRTGLMQEEDALAAAFNALPRGRIHALVLGGWDENAYILADSNATKRSVQRILRLRQNRHLIFRRGEPIWKVQFNMV
jgi:hypothetical protein